MARKPPSLQHIKWVHSKGKTYAYFNTGQKRDGRPIYHPMPEYASAGFHIAYGKLKAAREKRAAPEYTVASLTDDYLASATFQKRAANTQKNYRTQASKIKEVWGAFPVNELNASRVRIVIEGDKWPAGTASMVLAVIGVIYRWGRRNEKATVNPVRDIERPEGGSHEPWPEDILEAALKAEDNVVRLAVHMLYFTGQRIGDVIAMRWGDVRDGYVWVRQEKTGKVVEPPLSRELSVELEQTPRTGIQIMGGLTDSQVRRRLKKFTRSLGVETVPHGLRKNAVNALLEAGCTVPEVSAITGQTHQVVEEYAAQVNRRKLGKAAVLKFDRAREA